MKFFDHLFGFYRCSSYFFHLGFLMNRRTSHMSPISCSFLWMGLGLKIQNASTDEGCLGFSRAKFCLWSSLFSNCEREKKHPAGHTRGIYAFLIFPHFSAKFRVIPHNPLFCIIPPFPAQFLFSSSYFRISLMIANGIIHGMAPDCTLGLYANFCKKIRAARIKF